MNEFKEINEADVGRSINAVLKALTARLKVLEILINAGKIDEAKMIISIMLSVFPEPDQVNMDAAMNGAYKELLRDIIKERNVH